MNEREAAMLGQLHQRFSHVSAERVLSGEFDQLPEQAFYMVGGIDEAVEKAKKLAEEAVEGVFVHNGGTTLLDLMKLNVETPQTLVSEFCERIASGAMRVALVVGSPNLIYQLTHDLPLDVWFMASSSVPASRFDLDRLDNLVAALANPLCWRGGHPPDV